VTRAVLALTLTLLAGCGALLGIGDTVVEQPDGAAPMPDVAVMPDSVPVADAVPVPDSVIDSVPEADSATDAAPAPDAGPDAPMMLDAMPDVPVMPDAMPDAPVMPADAMPDVPVIPVDAMPDAIPDATIFPDGGPLYALDIGSPIGLIVGGPTVDVTISITRFAHFDGPVMLKLQGLPDAVVASTPTIQPGSMIGTIAITASAQAMLGSTTVELVGSAGLDETPVMVPVIVRVGEAAGTLDTTFTVTSLTPFGTNDIYTLPALRVRSDGAVNALMLGNHGEAAILQLDLSGAPDPRLGDQGVLPITDLVPADFQVDSAGSLVVAGSVSSTAAIARYDSKGTLDMSFAGGTGIFGSLAPAATALAIQRTGHIVYAVENAGTGAVDTICRLTPDGKLDSGFAGGAKCWTSESTGAAVDGIAVETAGQIHGGGHHGTSQSFYTVLLDASGGQVGEYLYPTSASGLEVARGVDVSGNDTVIAGYVVSTSNGSTLGAITMARSDRLEPNFSDSVVTADLGDTGTTHYDGLAVQSDGKPVVVGSTVVGGHRVAVLARYLTNGMLDGGFGTGGKVMLGGFEGFTRVAIAPDGRIVVGGLVSGNRAIQIARYWP
jgi:uncharacterized delta-60 repeat protein